MSHHCQSACRGLAILLALSVMMPATAAAQTPAAAAAPAAKATPTPAPKPATTAAPAAPAPVVKRLTTAVEAPAPPPGAAKAAPAKPASAASNPGGVSEGGQMWIRPFPNSRQGQRATRAYDDYWMALGRLSGEAQADKVELIGGKWTHAVYAGPPGASVAEVFRHYEQQIAKGGLELMYECMGTECGEGGRKTNGDWWWLSDHRRYLVARLKRQGGDLWVSVHCHARSATAPVQQEVDVVEAKLPAIAAPPRNEAEVAILAKELRAEGRVVLRSVGFSEGRPAVLPGSEPVVKAIADLLSRDPGLKLHVVVHSDDSGPWQPSMDLAKKRAAAVVSMLTRKYRIPSSRVQPAGVGPLAPIANNATPEGRSLNRRIELVPMAGSRAGAPAASVRR